MPSYSKELKQKLIEKMLSDSNTSIAELSSETGIHENTLRRWKSNGLKKGLSPSTKYKTVDKWSSQDKYSCDRVALKIISTIKSAEK